MMYEAFTCMCACVVNAKQFKICWSHSIKCFLCVQIVQNDTIWFCTHDTHTYTHREALSQTESVVSSHNSFNETIVYLFICLFVYMISVHTGVFCLFSNDFILPKKKKPILAKNDKTFKSIGSFAISRAKIAAAKTYKTKSKIVLSLRCTCNQYSCNNNSNNNSHRFHWLKMLKFVHLHVEKK